jgi:hypothetical protein
MGIALLYSRDEEKVTGHFNGCVKFECNERYHCIRKTILNEVICQSNQPMIISRIYYINTYNI